MSFGIYHEREHTRNGDELAAHIKTGFPWRFCARRVRPPSGFRHSECLRASDHSPQNATLKRRALKMSSSTNITLRITVRRVPRPGDLPVRRSKLLQLRRRRQQLLVLRAVLLVRVRRQMLQRRAARGGREGLQGLLLRRLGRIRSDLQADRRAAADVQTDDPEKIEKRSIPSPESLPKVN